MHVIIIGSGIGALGAAVRIRLQGHDVSVYEANDYPGGKLHSFVLGKYRFDGGPSLFTMPHFVDDLFHAAGKNPKDFFDYQRSDEACRYFWQDGKRLFAKSDPEQFAEDVEATFQFPKEDLIAYFDHVRNIYKTSGSIFLEKSLHAVGTWMHRDTLRALLQVRNFDIHRTMHHANQVRLGEPHLVQLFDRFATYNGSNPYKAPGILNVIPWLEHGFGTFFPEGGMVAIPRAVHRLAEELGVKFTFNAEVERIHVKKGKVKGIEVNGERVEAEAVVSNMDVYFTYRHLLPQVKAPERILNQERSSSALVFYWGIRGSFPDLGLHNIFFSQDYKTEFEAMFDRGEIHDDPTIYINVSSKLAPADAPEGCENWFVMINAPHESGQDWDAMGQKIKHIVLKKLSHQLGRDIEPLIEEEKIWNPKGIAVDTKSYRGALYGNSSNDRFAAFLRHPNASSSIKGLYFCGGSVHPGGGIPLALLSGKITAESLA